MGFEKVFIQIGEDYFIAQDLRRLVIHHQNVDLFFGSHLPSLFSTRQTVRGGKDIETTCGATCAKRKAAARYLPVLPDIPMLRPPGIFHDRLSWLWRSEPRSADAGTKDF